MEPWNTKEDHLSVTTREPAHRSKNHRPKPDHTYKSPIFPVLLRVLRTPDTPHTYLYSLSPLAITIALYSTYTGSCLRLFDCPFSDPWCTNPRHPGDPVAGPSGFGRPLWKPKEGERDVQVIPGRMGKGVCV